MFSHVKSDKNAIKKATMLDQAVEEIDDSAFIITEMDEGGHKFLILANELWIRMLSCRNLATSKKATASLC